ncbi:MAG: radical SAM protein, partial [Candidatus Enterosoma sp.]|nr:radical SAM protein [Candidatus Enterosoma sp.]
MISSLYLHIPFCDSLCHYCDFGKVLTGTFSQEKYIDSLLIELDSLAIPDDSLKTIYIGGGTPSALKPELLTRLLSRLHSSFPSVTEFTMECNPESLSEEKVKIISQFGVNRVSLGVQTFQGSLLSSLNRKHSKEQVFQSVSLLKKHGIT